MDVRWRVLGCAVAALASGCAARRELVIESDPPGALVRLDDTIVGTTPFETLFDAYGTRRVTLYREGYRTATKEIDLAPPWYAYFPLDIVSEVLLPFGWRYRHEEKFTLEPEGGRVTVSDLSAILEHAQQLRLAEPSGPRPAPPKKTPEKPAEPPKDEPR
jgi:hypothetical protein